VHNTKEKTLEGRWKGGIIGQAKNQAPAPKPTQDFKCAWGESKTMHEFQMEVEIFIIQTPKVIHFAKKFATSFAYKESTQDIEPLVDYNKSHIVTFIEYLEIIQQKNLDKEATEHIIEHKI
jgi:hypothetical protein